MESIHCSFSRFSTALPQRSHLPFTTSSFARPILSFGHQLITLFALYAKPLSYIFKNIHCVHLKYSGSVVFISRDQSKERPSDFNCFLKLSVFSLVTNFGCLPVCIA